MKKFFTAFSLIVGIVSVSLLTGCFNKFTVADFKKFISSEDVSSCFTNGFQIDVQDDAMSYLYGSVLADGSMELCFFNYEEDYKPYNIYFINDGFLYVDDGSVKSKIKVSSIEEQSVEEALLSAVQLADGYLADLKPLLLDEAEYYENCSKQESNDCEVYVLDDVFYDSSLDFDYREYFELTYKDNQIVGFVDSIIGEDFSVLDWTVSLTELEEEPVFPNFDEFSYFIDANELALFVEDQQNESDMLDYCFEHCYSNSTRGVGQYHKDADGQKMILKFYDGNSLSYTAYLLDDKIYVDSVSKGKICIDMNTDNNYYQGTYVAAINNCIAYGNNYADKILSALNDSMHPITEVVKVEKENAVEFKLKSLSNSSLSYTYENNKLVKVDITYYLSSVSQQHFVANACENTIELPTDLNEYEYVTSSSDLGA